MKLHLADRVQVRRESWGLLFYSQLQHRMYFIRSGNWLSPDHFDGTWTFEALIEDIATRQCASVTLVERNLHKITDNLIRNGVIICELQ